MIDMSTASICASSTTRPRVPRAARTCGATAARARVFSARPTDKRKDGGGVARLGRCAASGGFDDASRRVFSDAGMSGDEFGDPAMSGDGDTDDVQLPPPPPSSSGRELEKQENAFKDVQKEITNNWGRRMLNTFFYIVLIRLCSEFPMKYFATPAGAQVGGNVFSQFVNSIVPVAASTGRGWGDSAILGSGIPFFHVGIGPIIAASIAMQVIIALVPSMKELTKDAVGQHTVQQYTRYLMFAIAVIQSFLTASELRQFYVAGISPLGYYWTIVPIFVLGSCVLAWLSDEMTDFGLGQGSSVLITMSVCGAYWNSAKYYAPALLEASLEQVLPFFGAGLALIAGSVLVQVGTCKVPLLYFQGPSIPGLPRVVRKDVDHIPFKVNPLGVQPVLVAVFMCEGMVWLMNVMDPPGFIRAATEFVFSSASPMYYLTFFLIVFGFSYLDLQDTPKDVSEYMVKIGARIPEVRPGEATVRYLTTLQNGSRFFGGLLLGIVAVACTMMDQWMKATVGISVGFTSMLIVVSTILQIQRQVVALAQMPRLDRVIRSL